MSLQVTVRRRRSPMLAVIIAFFCAPASLAAQTAVMYYVPGLYYQAYSTDSPFSTSFEFTVARQGQGDIDFFVTVDGGLQNSFDPRYAVSEGNRIEYYIYDNLVDRNILKSGSGITSRNVIMGGFSDPLSWYESTTVGYSIYVPSGQFLPLGTYNDTLTFTLYTGTPDNYNPGTAVSLTAPVVLATERFLGLRLAPPGGTFESGTGSYAVDFGILEAGNQEELDMVVCSTIYFDVAFSSSHQGNLMKEGGGEQAPYLFRVDGEVMDLSGGWLLALENEGPTTEGERSYRIEIEIGDVDDLPAGVYTDSITVSVMSR